MPLLPDGLNDVPQVTALAKKYGVQPASINPNVFQCQYYKFGSVRNPDPSIRQRALDHILECAAVAGALEYRDISLCFADGSNYPGTQSIRHRIEGFEETLKKIHATLSPRQRLLIEHKPFEPAFTTLMWSTGGIALLLARSAGLQAHVLVDTGHHYQSQNIEQLLLGCCISE